MIEADKGKGHGNMETPFRPAPAPSGSVTEGPNIELAIRLLEAGNDPEKVEAALVYQGSTKEAARDLVQGILSGRINSPPSENDEREPTDWSLLPAPVVLGLGLLLLTGTIVVAAKGNTIYLFFLVAGLLISCAGLTRIMGPKRRNLSMVLCFVLIVLAVTLARFF